MGTVFNQIVLLFNSIKLGHITTLSNMLHGIRRAYLDIDSHSSSLATRHQARQFDLASNSGSWNNVLHLTNEERDQFDIQTKEILTRCANRVKDLEAIEKSMGSISSFAYFIHFPEKDDNNLFL